MAKSSAEYYEVRWRVAGSDEAWSAPHRVDPHKEIVVEDLEELGRGQTYEFEARAVSACGAKSDWAPSVDHTVPDAPAGTLTLDAIKAEADQASTDAAAANAELADIASDNVLTAGEKPFVIRDWNVISAEQAGIDAQATAYAITTEKAAYDSAVTALSTYLGTLTSPVLWSDLSGNTTIVGTTFRQKFADVYTTRQTLLNAIYAAAKAKAQAAQDAADAAQADADTANGQVTQLPVINGAFDMTPAGYGWTADAGSGWYLDTSGNSPLGTSNSGAHTGGVGASTGVYRNGGLAACQRGQVYKAQALIRAAGANGNCYVFISWCDASGNEVSTSVPAQTNQYGQSNYVTGTTSGQGSYVVGACPAGAVFARTCLKVTGHTAGSYYVDNVACTQHPASVDEVPDGTAYGKTRLAALVNGTIPLAGAGKALLANPTFLRNTMAVPIGAAIAAGAYVRDNWLVYASPSQWVIIPEASDILFRINTGAVQANNSQSVAVLQSEKFPVTPGQVLVGELAASVAALSTPPAGVSTLTRLYVNWTDAAGNFLDSAQAVEIGRSTATLRGSVTVPPTAAGSPVAGAYVEIKTFLVNLSGASYTAGNLPYDCRITSANVYSVQDLATEVTGTLSTLRNMPMVGVGNYASAWSGGTITYSASSTSATITAGAATLVAGNESFPYNQASTTVSGSAGATTKFYLYYDDPGYSGGSQTLHATTSVITSLNANGRLKVGEVTVTFPTSGTGTGGGSTGCVAEDAWVVKRGADGRWVPIRARDARVGDWIRGMDPTTGRERWVRISYRRRFWAAERVTVYASARARLTCTPTGPLGTADMPVLARDAAGARIAAKEGGCLTYREARVEAAAPGWAIHFTAEHTFFLAGDDPHGLLAHHNMKPLN